MMNIRPLGDAGALLPNTSLSHAQAVAAIARPVGVRKNARGGIDKKPVATAKCIKQTLLLPHIRSGLGSHRLASGHLGASSTVVAWRSQASPLAQRTVLAQGTAPTATYTDRQRQENAKTTEALAKGESLIRQSQVVALPTG